MGDANGRRGAADGTVTVRATRQLTDRHTWGIGGGQGEGCLSEYHTASMPEAMQGCSIPQSSDLSLLFQVRNVPGSSLAPKTEYPDIFHDLLRYL
jgi:hypothetical protein